MNISIIGTGYVGLVTGACFAKLGNNVICVDIDENKVNMINKGISPIYEEGLDEILSKNDKIKATTDYKFAVENSDITFICVGTPSKSDLSLDLSYIKKAAEEIGKQIKNKTSWHLVVVKSTVLPGTTKDIVLPIIEKHSGKKVGNGFGLAMNPEFLKEGIAIKDFLKPDRIVIGTYDKKSNDNLKKLYEGFTCPIIETTLSTAEMIKYASNAFLATKISFINEIGNICKKLGIDTYDVADGIGLDKRIGRAFLDSGIGWGGSCLKGSEKILLYENGIPRFTSFAESFQRYSRKEKGICITKDLRVLSWNIDKNIFEFKKILAITKRPYSGKINKIKTSMRKTISTTADHPMLLFDGKHIKITRSSEVKEGHRIPVLNDIPTMTLQSLDLIDIIRESKDFPPSTVYLKPLSFQLKNYKKSILTKIQYDERYTYAKSYEFLRKNYLPLDLFLEIEKELPFNRSDLSLYTAIGSTTYVPAIVKLDDTFWRFIGYYISEGHINTDHSGHGKNPRKRIMMSFNYKGEEEYIKDVENYLSKLKVKFTTTLKKTSTQIMFSSRILAFIINDFLGCGTDSYSAKIPDLIYTQPKQNRVALLSGLFRGDGHIAFPKHTNAVIYEYGSISNDLIQGMIFLLHSIDVVPSYKISRSAKSTAPAHFIRISSRNQVDFLKKLFLKQDQQNIQKRLLSYRKIITPTGHRREKDITSVKVRNINSNFEKTFVYSMEVEDNHNFVTTDGIIVHNCFPKDLDALISWYKKENEKPEIIQSTVKINEQQPLRLIKLLKKHIPQINGKTIGILGLAFKPNTDDIRESRAIPVVKQLIKEGANVKAYDPKAMNNFKKIFPEITYCSSAQEVLSSNAILITTKCEEFKKLNYTGKIVIDGRRIKEAKTAKIYEGVCW
jgi:UDPglucose 6-dehydrogenase